MRQRFGQRAIQIVLAIIIVGALGYGRFGPRATYPSDWKRFDHAKANVVEVIDGDTIDVDVMIGDKLVRERIRLLGTDAPELTDYWGERAMQYTKTRSTRAPVLIRLDEIETRDPDGRLLAYVWLAENDMLNEALVRDGQAYAYRVRTYQLSSRIREAEGDAARSRRGIWKEVTQEQMPEWRRAWMKERDLKWPP
ncbi:MAG TPA: thermonuclease family protein [Tepidisphaeraceae bacterium]|nr:thermonuclease family protein [Tepidisphaeraceae bacterium]